MKIVAEISPWSLKKEACSADSTELPKIKKIPTPKPKWVLVNYFLKILADLRNDQVAKHKQSFAQILIVQLMKIA
jgi:hypothetical protein